MGVIELTATRTRVDNMGWTRSLIASMAILGVVITGCGSSEPATAPTTPAGPPVAEITIDNFTFNTPKSVPAGATISVKNNDPAEHSVTADSGDAFNVEVESGESVTFTAPAKAGSYPYHCSYHPAMHGTLVVA